METKEKPITGALSAVRYAMKRAVHPQDWPQVIHVDENQVPLPRNSGGAGFIVVERRAGDPTPTDNDIMKAEATRSVADRIDRSFIDYIIIGTGCFYSFADERVVNFRLTDGGSVIPVPAILKGNK